MAVPRGPLFQVNRLAFCRTKECSIRLAAFSMSRIATKVDHTTVDTATSGSSTPQRAPGLYQSDPFVEHERQLLRLQRSLHRSTKPKHHHGDWLQLLVA